MQLNQMKKTLFFLIATAVFLLTNAHAQPQSKPLQPALTQTFDTTGHVKAHGARVTVGYPSGWKAQEGRGPKAVHSFAGDYAGVAVVLSLAIEAHDKDMEGVCAQASKDDWREGSAAANWTVTNTRVFIRRGKSAALIEINVQPIKLGGFVIHTQTQSMVVCHKRYMVKAICATSNTTPELTKSSMQKIAPLCQQYFDSLTLKG